MLTTTIIDCHTHAYPKEVVEVPRAWALERGETHWADVVAPQDRPSIQGWSDPQSMLAAMDAAGVERAVLLGWYWEQEATCRWHNDVMTEWIQAAPERLSAFAAIYPNADVIDQLEQARSQGLCGVGELHLGVQGFDADNPHWKAMAEWCVAHDWPINCHATEMAGHKHPGSVPTPVQNFVEMAEASPDLKLILAHWGGGLAFFEQNPRLRRLLTNVYYDASASPLLYDMGVFQQMAALVGPDKLLFGSDYPLRLYPRRQKTPDMTRYLEQIRESSGFTESELEGFLGGNFQRLMGWAD